MKNTREVWKDVAGFEGLYQISSKGRVKSLERLTPGKLGSLRRTQEKMMKLQKNIKGYPTVMLHKDGKGHAKLVHRLVAYAFIENPLNLPQVNHKDTNKENNNIENLEWITGIDNMRHAFANKCFRPTEKQREHARQEQMKIAIRRRRPVVMCTKEGEKLRCFESIREAEKATGINNSKITAVCKCHRKTAGGYIWKYKTI